MNGALVTIKITGSMTKTNNLYEIKLVHLQVLLT